MSTLRQAAQQALEALEKVNASPHLEDWHHAFDGEIDALRAALAEPEQEPVAWNWMLDGSPYGPVYYGNGPDADLAQVAASNGRTVQLLYTAPTSRNEPVIDKTMAKRIATQLGWEPPREPLTDDEIAIISVACAATHRHDDFDFARAIEKAHGIGDSNGS